MKRILTILLMLGVLAGVLLAHAETIREQVNAPEQIAIPTFQTATGQTVLTVDAIVEVPDVETLNTYQLRPRSFTMEEVTTILQSLGFENTSAISLTPKPIDIPDFEMAYCYIESNKYKANISNSIWKDSEYSSNINILQKNNKTEYFGGPSATPESFMPDETMEGCRYSRMEAEQMAVELAHKIAPDLSLNAKGILDGEQYAVGNTDKEIASNWDDNLLIPNAYFFVFTKTVNGIPVTPTQHSGGNPPDAEYAYLPSYEDERLNIVISDTGIDNIFYRTPYIIDKILQENIVTLLPFEQIVEIAVSILPLKIAAQESRDLSAHTAISIQRISFGYMRVQSRAQPGVFELLPVWDFFGTESTHADTWEYHANGAIDSYLTINAMDGLIIDREYGY